MTESEALRLECLKVAATFGGLDVPGVLHLAQILEEFIRGTLTDSDLRKLTDVSTWGRGG
jgi:hypothetical protein